MKKIPLPQPPHLLKSVPPVPQSPVKSAPPVPQSPVKSAPPVPQSSLKLPPPVPQSSLKLPPPVPQSVAPPVPQSVAPPVPQSVVPPVSNAKILGKFLTGYKDTDYKILSSLPDKDLINFCVSNRNPICEDENFWKNRLINKWGMEAANLKVEKYKEKNKKGILEEKPRTWKSYYLSLLYYDTRYFPKKAASKAALAGLEDIVMFYGDKANRHNIVYNAAKGGHMELAKKISGFLDNAIVWAGIRTGKKELLINEKSVKTIMLIGPSEIIGYRTGKSRNIEHIKWVRGIFWDVNYSDKNKHRYIKDFDFAVIRGLAKYGDLGNIKKLWKAST